MTKIEIPPQDPIPFNPVIYRYGKWRLGFEWNYYTLGNSRPVLGLGLLIQQLDNKPQVYLTRGLPEAIAFAERCELGPKRFAQFMGDVLEFAAARTFKAKDLKPWL